MSVIGLYSFYCNWQKAPQDATHFCPESENTPAMWYKDGHYWHDWNFHWQPMPPDSEPELHNMHPRSVTLQNANLGK